MRTLTIAKRELASFFFSPIAYLVMAAFVLLAGLFFMIGVFRPEQAVSMRFLFQAIVFVLIAILPAISMRLLSEEIRSGTLESLLTSPLTDGQIIIGKWLGALAFYFVLLVPTAVYLVLLENWANPDYGPIVSGYVGLLCVGGFYLAIGTFISSLTQNQIVAWVITFFIILAFTVATAAWAIPRFIGQGDDPVAWGMFESESTRRLMVWLVVLLAGAVISIFTGAVTRSWQAGLLAALVSLIVLGLLAAMTFVLPAHALSQALLYINVNAQYEDFAKGLIDISNVVYFASGIALFLVLAVVALQSRKWR